MTRWRFTQILGILWIGCILVPIVFLVLDQNIKLVFATTIVAGALAVVFLTNGLMYRCRRCNGRIMTHEQPVMRVLPPPTCPKCTVTLRWR